MKSITASLYCLLLVSLLLTTTCLGLKTTPPSSSQQSTDIHRHTSNQQQHPQNNKNEIEKYSSLPHTIFSSNGRLYNVEKASLQSSNNDDDDDIHVSSSRSLVFAIQFGNSDSILVISTCPRSPYLFHNNGDDDNDKDGNNGNNNNDNDETITNEQSKTSLWNYNVYNNNKHNNHNNNKRIIPSYPISILTPKLLIGTGGTSIDSIVLHDKILEIFLSLVQIKDGMNSTHRIQGIVKSSLLARKVADSLQVFTQDVSSGYGRILSVRSVFVFCFVLFFLLVYLWFSYYFIH